MAENTQLATQKDVKGWLQSGQFKEAVAQALPAHMTPERFVRVALTALMKTPALAQCSQESILKVMLDLSSLGLEPDGRRAHVIPYGKTAQLIIDYKGLIELAKRSGEVESWRAELVCENDEFSWEDGKVHHRIDWKKPRGKLFAVYSHVRNKNGIEDFEVMTIEEVEAIRGRSKAANSGPWKTDFNEMAKKTVIRRHAKRLTLSPDMIEAMDKDFDRLEEPQVEMPRRASEVAAELLAMPMNGAEKDERPITQQQVKRLMALCIESGVTEDQIKDYILREYDVEHRNEINRSDYDSICEWVQDQKPPTREPGDEEVGS